MTTSKKMRSRSHETNCTPQSRRRSGMAISAAVTLLALSQQNDSGSSNAVEAFTQPLSAVRIPQHSSTTQMYAVELDMSYNGDQISTPIRSRGLARLTHSEEVSLLQQMRTNPTHSTVYQMARETLLLHNLPLVQSIVTKILRSRPHLSSNSNSDTNHGNSLSRDDLLHEGTIGLAEAIDKYDLAYANMDVVQQQSPSSPSSSKSTSSSSLVGARLGTYATYWIRARILRAIQSREHAIRFPEHVLQASHRLVKTAKDMGLDWGVVTELADFDVISVSQEKLREKLREAAGIKSDNLFRDAVRVRSISRSGSTTLETWMAPSSAASTASEDELLSEGGQEQMLETLSKFLIPREIEVLSLRYGLVSTKEEEESVVEVQSAVTLDKRVFHDYQAEAEEDLFGLAGILSHYSSTPAVATVSPAKTKAATSAASPVTSSSLRMASQKMKKATPTLLPFKDIGKRMKFSGEYCRRTCTVALNKLTTAVEDGRLAESDFLLAF